MAKQNVLSALVNDGPIIANEHRSLSAETAEKLRELILLEKLPPGMHIPERDLAEALGISRTPMREALRTLAIEGLVEFTATRRSRVANPSIDELRESMTVLATLEALGGELACAIATDREITAIADLNQKMIECTDKFSAINFFNTDMAFHSSIIASTHNQALIDTHRQYNAKLWRARFMSSKRKQGRAKTLQQHQDITNALVSRHASKMAQVMRSHIETAIDNLSIQQNET
tara:strand:+ start:879 stop:1577 length:699 start_codon:yes stop_codon:yes gene_type:complete